MKSQKWLLGAFCLKFLQSVVSTYAVISLTYINILPKSVTAAQAIEKACTPIWRGPAVLKRRREI